MPFGGQSGETFARDFVTLIDSHDKISGGSPPVLHARKLAGAGALHAGRARAYLGLLECARPVPNRGAIYAGRELAVGGASHSRGIHMVLELRPCTRLWESP